MMRSQRIGRRYLAGFVIAAAIVYFAVTCIVSAMAWRDSYPPWLLGNLFVLGLMPALAALTLGVRAWSANSAGLSAIALVVLLVAIALWQLFVVAL
jgi:hypothetical protein